MGDWDQEDRRDEINCILNDQIKNKTRPTEFGKLLRDKGFSISEDLNDSLYEHYTIKYPHGILHLDNKDGKYRYYFKYNEGIQSYPISLNIDGYINKIKNIHEIAPDHNEEHKRQLNQRKLTLLKAQQFILEQIKSLQMSYDLYQKEIDNIPFQ